MLKSKSEFTIKEQDKEMEETFQRGQTKNMASIKLGTRLKSYLDAAGVPTEYYSDNKMPKYVFKVEPDPLKQLIDDPDKNKVTIPEKDTKIDLVNRLSQLTLIQ